MWEPLGLASYKQYFLSKGTTYTYEILLPVKEPGSTLSPSREQTNLYFPWPWKASRSASLIGLVTDNRIALDFLFVGPDGFCEILNTFYCI